MTDNIAIFSSQWYYFSPFICIEYIYQIAWKRCFIPVYSSEKWYFVVLWNCISPWLSQIASINPFYFYMKGQLSRFMMRSHLRKANIRTLYYVFINVCKNINGDWQFFLVFYYYHLQHNLERQVEYYRYCTWSWDNHRNNCLLNYILTAVNDLCSLCIGTWSTLNMIIIEKVLPSILFLIRVKRFQISIL